jgi:uncharacterized protein YecE (DUF72 family)
MAGKVFIGTSGWSYKHWKETFYPPKLKATDWFDYYTHMKKLKDCKEPLLRFFEVFAPMQQLMGPVLVQLPPMLHFHAHVAEEFFNELYFIKKMILYWR